MSQTDSPTGEEIRRTVQIPSLLTNSLRAVLAAFGQKIIRLKASGSIETTNGTLLDDLREYGVSWEQQDQQYVSIDYEQLPGADGPTNPLTAEAQTELLEEVEARLAPQHTNVKPDLAVTQFTIRVTDERLQAVTPAQTPEFDLRFVSDPAEPPIRDVTKRYNADRNLYAGLGFEVRNLNLRSVIETETKFHEQADGKYLSWAGPDDIRPRSPERLAVRINDHVLPDAYGVLKPYVVTGDQMLELGDKSAGEVYGDPEINPQPEDYRGNVDSYDPTSCYDESKRYGESLVRAYRDQHGLDVRVGRIFNTYGPRMRLDDGRVIPNFVRQALTGEDPTVYGDGEQTRAFCYVSDMIDGLVALIESDVQEPVNIGNPDERTINELAQIVIEVTGSNSGITREELPPQDPQVRRPDISKARSELGWEPTVSLRDGLAKSIGYFEAQL